MSSPPNTFSILYFATAQSYTRTSSEHFPAPLALSSLFTLLEEKYPGIRASVLSHSMLTVNLEYVDMDDEGCEGGRVLQAGDEVAVIPPVSSG